MPNIAGKELPYQEQPSFKDQNPAVQEANKLGQELAYIPLESVEPEFPMSNAMERSQVTPMPDDVGSVGYAKKGGKV